MPRPLPDPTPPSRATIRTIHQLGDRIRATRAGEGMPVDQAARSCGVSVGMLSKLENGKGVNLEHVLRVLDGLGLTMLVVPKAHAPWLEEAAAHASKTGELAAWDEPLSGAASEAVITSSHSVQEGDEHYRAARHPARGYPAIPRGTLHGGGRPRRWLARIGWGGACRSLARTLVEIRCPPPDHFPVKPPADALVPSFRIGREVGVPVVISHLKVVGEKNKGRSQEALSFIERNMATQPICIDCYPYTAGSTVLSAHRAASSTRVIVSWSKSLPEFAGQDLDAIARKLGVDQEEAIRRLSPAGGIYFRLDEGDVQRILKHEKVMIGSDGLPHDTSPHPRLWGSFPRVLGHYGRTLGLFPLETAVHKMTGLTAKNFGLQDRGLLKEGAFADLVLFDAETIDAAATYEAPTAPAHGIDTVIVNGSLVWHGGRSTGARPGRVLARHQAS